MTQNTVEASKRYQTDRYGEVQVLEMWEWIDKANAEGVIDSHLVVKYDTEPNRGGNMERNINTADIFTFIGMLEDESTSD